MVFNDIDHLHGTFQGLGVLALIVVKMYQLMNASQMDLTFQQPFENDFKEIWKQA